MKRLILLLFLFTGLLSFSSEARQTEIMETNLTNTVLDPVLASKEDRGTNKFGYQVAVGTAEISVWEIVADYVFPASAIAMKVSSSSATDTIAGTGARTFTVVGLDENWDQASETVNLDGQTEVLTTTTFIRVFRAYVATAGSGGTAVGDIYVGTGTVTTGVPATKYAKVLIGNNQTLMAIWTVPADYTAYIQDVHIAVGDGKEITWALYSIDRVNGAIPRVRYKLPVYESFNDNNFKFPYKFTEKTDIIVKAKAATGTVTVGASFGVILVTD